MKTLRTAIMDLMIVIIIMFGLMIFAFGIHTLSWGMTSPGTGLFQIVLGLVLVFGAYAVQRKFVHPKQEKKEENKDAH